MSNDKIRIRCLAEEDIALVKKLVKSSLHDNFLSGYKMIVLQNWKIQTLLFSMVILSSIYIENIAVLFLLYISGHTILFILWHYVWNQELNEQTSDLNDWNLVSRKYIKFWVAETKTRGYWDIVGTIALISPSITSREEAQHCNDAVELKRMCVSSYLRKRGIAIKLMKFAEEQAGILGFKSIILYTLNIQVPAVKLYKKVGFNLKNVRLFTRIGGLIQAQVYCFSKKLEVRPGE